MEVVEALSGALSGNNEIRVQAEQALNTYDSSPGFGVTLAEIMIAPSVRHLGLLAGVLLKRHVMQHWMKTEAEGSPILNAHKPIIRQKMLEVLNSDLRKIRTSAAIVVASIAKYDYPENWPDLFDILIGMIRSNSSSAVHGGIRCLSLLVTKDFMDGSIIRVVPVLFPELLKILSQTTVEGGIRARSCVILYNALEVLGWLGGDDDMEIVGTLQPILDPWMNLYVQILQSPFNTNDSSEIWIRIEILRIVSFLLTQFKRMVKPYSLALLPGLWNLLIQSESAYVSNEIFGGGDDGDDGADSDGDRISLDMVISEWLEAINAIIQVKATRKAVKTKLTELFYRAILLLQMTNNQLSQWEDDPNAYITHEDDESFDSSVRLSCLDLVGQLVEMYGEIGLKSLVEAAMKHVIESQQNAQAGNPNWWRQREAAIFAICSMAEHLTKIGDQEWFTVKGFLTQVLTNDIQNNAVLYLRGRAIVCSAAFAAFETVDHDIAAHFFRVSVEALSHDQKLPSRIFACRAISKLGPRLDEATLVPCIAPIITTLLELLHVTTEDSLFLVLEALKDVIGFKYHGDALLPCVPAVASTVLRAMERAQGDVMIMSECVDVIGAVGKKNDALLSSIQGHVIPAITPIFQSPSSFPHVFAAMVIDIASAIAVSHKSQQEGSSGSLLPPTLIEGIFPCLIDWLLKTDDSMVLQNGTDCLRSFIRSASQQITVLNHQGRNGIQMIMLVLAKLLVPAEAGGHSDNAVIGVGDLIIQLILRFGDQINCVLRDLLSAVLTRLSTAKLPSTIASFISVFARLAHTQPSALLDCLSSLQCANMDGLSFVMKTWARNQTDFHAPYTVRVTISALALLMTMNDGRLMTMVVDGELEVDKNAPRKTRSQGKLEERWTQVPLPVKVFSEIVKAVKREEERKARNNEDGDDDEEEEYESDDEDDEDDDDDDDYEVGGSVFAPAEDYEHQQIRALMYGGGHVDDDDEDHLADPLYAIDLKSYCNDFIRSFAQHNTNAFAACYQALSPRSKNAVKATVGMP